MHNLDLILTLTGGLFAALVFGYLTQRMGLSPLVGYLFAGIAVGPHTPGFVANHELAEQLAEIGVILLMFGVGLEFHLEQLLAVRRVAVPGAVFQSLIATIMGAAVVRYAGWDWPAAIVFGLAVSVASTVVLTRVLADNRDLHTQTGHIAVGWLVVEDVLTVIVLVMLPALFKSERAGIGPIAIALGATAFKFATLLGFTAVFGSRLLPWLLTKVALTRSRELFTLTILVIALGIAVGSAKVFGVSMALGAFLAGMVVGRSEFSHRAASEAMPMRDAFAVLFFVSVGMLLDPTKLMTSPGLILGMLAVILVGKPLAAFVIVVMLGRPTGVALAVAAALAQIGEFSFILATVGRELKILPEGATNILIVSAIVSITVNPVLYRLVKPFARWISRIPPLPRRLQFRKRLSEKSRDISELDADETVDAEHRAIVVGYGPVGQTVTRLLRDNGIEPTVIELNLESTRRLKESGIRAVYGDASQRASLESAGIREAGNLIVSAFDAQNAQSVIRLARELNPTIRILARSTYVGELSPLVAAGANHVFAGEAEVGLALAEIILRNLGATPEQIDRERARVHFELLGRPD